MAFTVVEKRKTNFNGSKSESTASVSKYKGAAPHIHVSTALAENLGWKRGDKAIVAVGSGSDYGWVSVAKSSTGFAMSSTGGKDGRAVKIGCTGILDGVTHATVTRCTFNIVDGKLFLKIPDRFLPMSKDDMNSVFRQQPFSGPYVSPRAG